jgi:glycerol-3-phosphate acyltransferase PlsY
MEALRWACWLSAAYLIGSIPFGLLVARMVSGVDVRSVGSGNIGATNVRRAAGSWAGALVLVLDAAKAGLPTLLAARSASDVGWLGPAIAVAAFLGHCFPIYLRGRGGKGVASALGAILVLAPTLALLACSVFAIAVALTRVAAVGSLAAAATVVVAAWTSRLPAETTLAITTMSVVIVLRHRENIVRLWKGSAAPP